MSKKTAGIPIPALLGGAIIIIVVLSILFPLNVKATAEATTSDVTAPASRPVGKRVEWKSRTTTGINHILLLPTPCADPILQSHVAIALARLPLGINEQVAPPREAESYLEGQLTAACWITSPLDGQVLLVRPDGAWLGTGLTEDAFTEEAI